MADMLDFAQVQQKASDLETLYRDRNTMFDDIEQMFLMNWTGPQVDDGELKLTISPSARNAALGAIRILTAADPIWTVQWEINDEEAREQSEIVEKFANALWFASGRIRQRPIHYDGVTSAVLFGEVHLGMSLSDDLTALAENVNESAALRLKRSLSTTPLLFEIFDPRTGYPEYDSYGLSSYVRKVKARAGEVLDKWGETAIAAGLDPEQRNADIEYWDYWDYVYHVVWVSGTTEPLYNGKHGLGTIPVVCYITDGSLIHSNETNRRQPFLYALLKSNLWERENLSLTFIHDNIAKMGLTPTYRHKKADENDEIYINTSVQGGVISSRGEFSPIPKNLIDPAVKEALEMDSEIITQSTLFKQALGQPVGANTPFSAVSLLNQTGRLPLVAIQRLCSEAFGKAMETAFFILREKGGKAKASGKEGILTLSARQDIPEDLVVQAKLDLSLPTDDQQNAMVALQLVQSGLVTKRYARENFIGVGQSKDMEQQIFDEKMDELMFAMEAQKEQARLAAQMQKENTPLQPDAKRDTMVVQPGQEPLAPTGNMSPTDMAAMMGGGEVPAESLVPRNGLPAVPLAGPQPPTNVPGTNALGG